jgi:ribonuclease HII
MAQATLAQLLDFDNAINERYSSQTFKILAYDKQDHETVQQLLSMQSSLPHTIIGLDEVGRGCLAGPVVAAAVILPDMENNSILQEALSDLNDSKALQMKDRERLSELLHEHAQCAIAEASVEEIDQINILQASLLAMKRARKKLKDKNPALLLVDGNQPVKGLTDKQITVIGGDGRSASIAAASVVAKVYRDKLMIKLSQKYTHYQWHKNKGYSSGEHIEAMRVHGLSDYHRQSFKCTALMKDTVLITDTTT